MHPKPFVAATILVLAVAAATVDDPDSTTESCAKLLGSEVCTWIVEEGGRVVELGATIPMSLIDAVPTDVEMVWPPEPLISVPLPPDARTALGIDHMGINWEAHGHPPASFLTEHFDFHFYSITRAEVAGIDCSDASKPSDLPPGYALPDVDVPGLGMLAGLCVPRMGMHAMPTPDVDAIDPFDASMMVGYYGGRPVFFEPMVSRELLRARSSFGLAMPPVVGLPAGVHYPSEFRAEYEADPDRYRLVFTGFPTP